MRTGASVESEIENNGTVIPAAPATTLASKEANVKKFEAATPKQLKFIMDLIRDTRFDATAFL